MNAEDSRISFVPNSSYLLECEYGPNKYVYRHDDNAMRIKSEETKGSEWLFEMVGENSYYIKHVETGKYLSAAEKSVQMKLVEKNATEPYHMETLDNNYFALGCSKGYINYEHQRGNLQGGLILKVRRAPRARRHWSRLKKTNRLSKTSPNLPAWPSFKSQKR